MCLLASRARFLLSALHKHRSDDNLSTPHSELPRQQHQTQEQQHFVGSITNLILSNAFETHGATFIMRVQKEIKSSMRSAEVLRENDSLPTRGEADIAKILNQLASPDFPPELLLQVVETTVVSQVNHWNVTDSHTLSALAKSLFAWPKGVIATTCRLLIQMAETALLKRCIIKIPADVDERRPPKYEIPPVLLGRGTHVKHLVLDLDVHVGSLFDRELIVSTGHMDLLAEAFPRLAVCTFLLHIGWDSCVVPPGGFIDVSILYHPNYRLEKSSTSLDSPPRTVKCMIEDNLVDFIAAFARSGPGRRKLIRFSRLRPEFRWSSRGVPPREFRPLVRVSNPDVPSTASSTGDALADAEKQSILNAKRILDEAFLGVWTFR